MVVMYPPVSTNQSGGLSKGKTASLLFLQYLRLEGVWMVTDSMCCIFQVSPPSIIGSIQNCCNGSTAHRRSKYLDIPAANSAATPKTRWDLSCPPSDGVDDLVSKMKVCTLPQEHHRRARAGFSCCSPLCVCRCRCRCRYRFRGWMCLS